MGEPILFLLTAQSKRIWGSRQSKRRRGGGEEEATKRRKGNRRYRQKKKSLDSRREMFWRPFPMRQSCLRFRGLLNYWSVRRYAEKEREVKHDHEFEGLSPGFRSNLAQDLLVLFQCSCSFSFYLIIASYHLVNTKKTVKFSSATMPEKSSEKSFQQLDYHMQWNHMHLYVIGIISTSAYQLHSNT